MKNRFLAWMVAVILTGGGAAWAAAQVVELQGFNDQKIGVAEMDFTTDGVALKVELQGASVGWHDVTVLGVGDCSDFDNLGVTGAINAERVDNDLAVEERERGGQSGLYVMENGRGSAQFILRGVNEAALRDADGSALVIFNAEEKKPVACGVVEVARP